MAGSSRRFALAVILLPLLVLVMAGVSRAAIIHVNSLSSEPGFPLLCTLPDAVASAEGTLNACVPGTGNDTIVFDLTGTIIVDEPIIITASNLDIEGPNFSGIVIDGGGTSQIFDHESGNLEISNITFQNGVANGMFGIEGGAILGNSSGGLEIENCTFSKNFAVTGGALFAGGTGDVNISNTTFAGNIADPMNSGSGGAIFNNGASPMNITNCTFFLNDAATDLGAGLGWQTGFAPAVRNSVFESIDPSGVFDDSDNCQASGLVGVDGGFNISDDETCFSGATSSLINTAVNLDPAGLKSNGGPTQTIAPQAGSPAIDFAPIANCVEFDSELVTTDQRGFGRPDDGESFCDAGAFETGAIGSIVFAPNSERVQIARSTTPNTDKVNIGLTFTINNFGDDTTGCNPSDDALNTGFTLSLFEGTCAAIPLNGLKLSLSPFVVHTVNHQSYGTLFQMSPPDTLQQSTETVSARLVALHTPPAPACGSWTLNLEVAGLNTNATNLSLGGGNPFALVLTNLAGDRSGCFDVTNAIVGNQLPTPPHHSGVRRGTRR
jgi:hypothetical protein